MKEEGKCKIAGTQVLAAVRFAGRYKVHSRYRVDLNILKIQSNKLLLFGGKFGINRYAH